MDKKQITDIILGPRLSNHPVATGKAQAFAPTNIALCKYWGKRNSALHLPVTSSLSITLPTLGSDLRLEINDKNEDNIFLNGTLIPHEHIFHQNFVAFINLFRTQQSFNVDAHIQMNIPTSAGLASSAAGYASVVLALNKLFNWQLKKPDLSILARLGSGSACRSFWPGFVKWHVGERTDGMDSYAQPFSTIWPEFIVGIILLDPRKKLISSRDAMAITTDSSSTYSAWPDIVQSHLEIIEQAIHEKDFAKLGKAAQNNAMAMHKTMLGATPSIDYSTPKTIQTIETVLQLQRDGHDIYYTQDAGPNIKLIFQEHDIPLVKSIFDDAVFVKPF